MYSPQKYSIDSFRAKNASAYPERDLHSIPLKHI